VTVRPPMLGLDESGQTKTLDIYYVRGLFCRGRKRSMKIGAGSNAAILSDLPCEKACDIL